MKPNFYAQKSPTGLKQDPKKCHWIKAGPKKVQQLKVVLLGSGTSDALGDFVCSLGQILIASENRQVYPIPSD